MPAATHSAAGTFSRYGACGRSIPTRASALPGVDGRTAASFPTAGGGGGEDPTCAPKETPSSDVPPVSTPEPSVVGVASSSCRTGLRRACARIAANAGTHGHLPVLWTSCPGPCGWQLAQRHSRMSRSVQDPGIPAFLTPGSRRQPPSMGRHLRRTSHRGITRRSR